MELSQGLLWKVIFVFLSFNINKTFLLAPHEDTSINNIIVGIGAVVVILIFLLIIIKLIHKCYKMYQADDEEEEIKDQRMFI